VPTTSLRERVRQIGLVIVSLAICLIALELGLRAANGWLGTWPNFVLAARTVLTGFQEVQYVRDPTLGYVPRPGYATDSVHIDSKGLRASGDPLSGPPILAVGDSYTYGEEVKDAETWPAHLQQLLGRRVLNGGVPGYGFDQTVLRVHKLAPVLGPSAVVVSFIADDLRRAEVSRLWSADKPYFDIDNGRLTLRNVPVQPRTDPRRTLSFAQKTLGYSYLFDFIMRRLGLMEDWFGDHIRVHPAGTGEKIACLLTDRLRDVQQASGVPLLLVAQYDPYVFKTPAFGEEQRRITGRLLDCARARGLKVLDTFDAIAKSDAPLGLYGQWHMNDKGNALIAQLIAAALR
jgi:lysophospholipase L1-like esterase